MINRNVSRSDLTLWGHYSLHDLTAPETEGLSILGTTEVNELNPNDFECTHVMARKLQCSSFFHKFDGIDSMR